MDSTELYRDLLQIVSDQITLLPDKPEETSEGIVRSLWHMAGGVAMSIQSASKVPLPALDAAAIATLHELVVLRVSGVPLAYLVGRQRFMGLDLLIDHRALIPRKETELIGHTAVDALRGLAGMSDRVTAIDVCTGSGNLALALAHYVPQARVFASDLSSEAVDLARRNVLHLGLEDRVEISGGDLFAPFDDPSFHGHVDLITCNPPYISSRKVDAMPNEIMMHEPRLAFDGGVFGISLLNRFIQESPRFLRKGGRIVFEVGHGQGPAILRRLGNNGNFCEIIPIQDTSSGEIRGLMASFKT
jgi:release factor glutamine methyltransferase